MIRLIGRLLRETRGGTAIEYGFILALVVIALIAVLVALAGRSVEIWSNVSDKVISAGS